MKDRSDKNIVSLFVPVALFWGRCSVGTHTVVHLACLVQCMEQHWVIELEVVVGCLPDAVRYWVGTHRVARMEQRQAIESESMVDCSSDEKAHADNLVEWQAKDTAEQPAADRARHSAAGSA